MLKMKQKNREFVWDSAVGKVLWWKNLRMAPRPPKARLVVVGVMSYRKCLPLRKKNGFSLVN
jgi:hypothetical protein